MKKVVKRSLIVVGILVGLLVIVAVGYKVMFSQGVAESFEINSPDLETKVLLATQGSAFKNALVAGITEDLGKKQVYINVIDVTGLPDIKEEDWNAVVLISTWEAGKLQADTTAYLNQAKELNKHVLLITSGAGTWKPEDSPVDSMSSASRIGKVDSLVADILKQLDGILGKIT